MHIDPNGPVNPSDAFKYFEQLQQDPEAELKTDPPEDKQPPKEEAPKEEQTEAPKDDAPASTEAQEPQGVLARDGKNVIPYTVLKSERERAAAAERQLQEAMERVKDLEKRVADAAKTGAKDNGEDARATPQTADEAEISAEDFAFLETEFPTVAKAIKAAMKRAEALEAKLQPVEERIQSDDERQAQQRAMTVQEAIDANPKLAHIQASDPELFAAAQQFDEVLRNQRAWADKPLAERFAKVIDMVEATNGAIDVPGHTPPAKQPDPAQLREAAAKAAAEQAKKAAVPTSLSQFPAGEPAATDEVEALAQMSHADVARKLAKMTPEQQMEFLANL